MTRARGKDVANPLSGAKFPIIFEQGQPKAVIVDIHKYREFELLVDNLINLREEDEDAILTESGILQKLVVKARQESRSSGERTTWEDEIDAL
jgi:hypothetical protein